MNKKYLFIALAFIVLSSTLGVYLFNNFIFKKNTGSNTNSERSFFDKLTGKEEEIEKQPEVKQDYKSDIEKVAKARLEAGLDATLVEKLRIYNLHDITSKEFTNTLAWARDNSRETSEITLSNCKADPAVIKITAPEFTFINNDSVAVNILGNFTTEGMLEIPAGESVKLDKLLTNSVVAFSCKQKEGEGQGAGFIYFE